MNDHYLEEMPSPSRDFVLATPDSALEVRPPSPGGPRGGSRASHRVVACGVPERLLRVSARLEPVRREARAAPPVEPGS